MVDFYVEIKGKVDSRALWDALCGFDHYEETHKHDINVTDLETKTLVYGCLPVLQAVAVIGICEQFGDAKATFRKE